MYLLSKIYEKVPHKIRKLVKNKYTLILHQYLILRPVYTKSIINGITIELTDRCNLRCSYCPKSYGIGIESGDMDFGLFKKIVDDAHKLIEIHNVCLVGFGEPLLYPYLVEAIDYIKKKDSQIKVSITTNGVLLNDSWTRRLIEVGLDQITISVNAVSRDQYLKINNADLYSKVVSNTCNFLDTVNDVRSPMRVLIQLLDFGPNVGHDEKNFRKFWEPKLGKCGEIQIQPFVNWGGLLRKPQKPKHQENTNRYPCAHLQASWIITREGNALACCMVFPGNEGDLKLGNVKDRSLRELYMQGKILELRKLNIEGKLYDLSPCKICDAYKTVPNVWLRNPFYPLFGKKWI